MDSVEKELMSPSTSFYYISGTFLTNYFDAKQSFLKGILVFIETCIAKLATQRVCHHLFQYSSYYARVAPANATYK